jgi:HPt (histidine-containing phosphotransfer) domain-containing protein
MQDPYMDFTIFHPANDASSKPLCDSERINMIIERIGPIFLTIAEKFFDSCTSIFSELSENTASQQVRESAHQLKGSAGNLGLSRLEQIFTSIEAAAITGNPITDSVSTCVLLTLEETRLSLKSITSHLPLG